MFGSFSQRIGVIRSYARKGEIICEDDPATRVYEVISGTVCTAKMLRDGRRQVGGFYFSGDVFGLRLPSNTLWQRKRSRMCGFGLSKNKH